MKIYATTNNISIEDFAGTDLWVRCDIDDMTDQYYVNFLGKCRYSIKFGLGHRFPAHWVDNPSCITHVNRNELKTNYIDYEAMMNVSRYHIIFPIDVLTTQELCEIMEIPL